MLSLFKRKRHDPDSIAHAVLKAASDLRIIAGFLKEFASSEDELPRVLLGVVIYAYCWAKIWTVKKKDIRVSNAYSGAGEIIASQYNNAASLVRVSDYLLSELEVATFSVDFCDYFRQRVPLNIDPHSDVLAEMKAHDEAIRSHQIRFETLIRMIMLIRNRRMTEEISRCIASNMDDESTVMVLGDMLFEQISGVTPLALAADFVLWHAWDESRPRRREAILALTSRLETELEAL